VLTATNNGFGQHIRLSPEGANMSAGKNAGASKASSSSDAVDPELREYMREWRRCTAQQQGVPAFVVMHDTSLNELCRRQPTSIQELLGVPGFGVKKAETYGLKILEAFDKFRNGTRAEARMLSAARHS
jgi:superfamily II DNA helicase RecQ